MWEICFGTTGYTVQPFDFYFFLKFFSYYSYCVRISGTWGETSKHRRINMAERLTKEQKRNYADKAMRPPKLKATNISLAAEKAALKGQVPDNMLNEIAQKNVNNKLKRAAAGES